MTWREWFYLLSFIFIMSTHIVPRLRSRKLALQLSDLKSKHFWYITLLTVAIPQVVVLMAFIGLFVDRKTIIHTFRHMYDPI